MGRLRQHLLARAFNLRAHLARRRQPSEPDLRRADGGPGPRFRFAERLRDAFRRRWLRVRK